MAYRRDFGDELDDLRDDLSRLREDAGALIGSLLDAGRKGSGTISRRVMEQAETWLEDLQQNLGEVRDRGREHLSNLSERVGNKPLVGVLLAVGAGLAIAALLGRRDRWS